MTTNDDKKVEQLIGEFNRAWTDGRLDDLSVFFDERVVAIAPNGGRVEGREAMVEGPLRVACSPEESPFRSPTTIDHNLTKLWSREKPDSVTTHGE